MRLNNFREKTMNKEKQDFIEKLNGRFGLFAILIFIGATGRLT
jgi:hypothetical protein